MAQRVPAACPETQLQIQTQLLQPPQGTLNQEPLSGMGKPWELAPVLNLLVRTSLSWFLQTHAPQKLQSLWQITLNVAATLVKFAMLPPMMRILPGFGVREIKKG